MSKVVTIPDYTRPNWVCCINGVRYAYPAGSTQEVPDEVAELLEDHLEQQPVPDPEQPSGGVSSWNDLTDKPFYEETTPGINIEWDGNTDGLESVDAGGQLLYKVSDIELTQDMVKSGTKVTVVHDSTNQPATFDGEFGSFSESVCYIGYHDSVLDPNDPTYMSTIFVVTAEESSDLGVTISRGVWFADVSAMSGLYTQRFTIPGSTVIHKLDEKYLPETAATKEYVEEVILGGAW